MKNFINSLIIACMLALVFSPIAYAAKQGAAGGPYAIQYSDGAGNFVGTTTGSVGQFLQRTTSTSYGWAAGATTTPNVSNVTGFLPIVNGGSNYNFPTFYAKLAQTIKGNGNTHICVIGESREFGVGSTASTAGTGQNYPAYSWPTQLANFITNTYGIKAHWNSFFGANGVNSTSYLTSDSRITAGSSWSSSNDFVSLGLNTIKASTTTNALSFLPTTTVDTFKIYYIINSGNGTFSYQVNSGSVTNVNTATGANNTIGSVTTTAALASNTLNLLEVSGNVYIVGVEAWDSSQSWVSVMNMGQSGSSTVQWSPVTSNAYSPNNSLAYQAVGCDLTVVAFWTNDSTSGTNLTTFSNNIGALVVAAQGSGDVFGLVGMAENPSGGGMSYTIQNSYASAAYNKYLALNVPAQNNYVAWGTYASFAPYNLFTDTFAHPNKSGYTNIAQQIAGIIMPPKIASFPLGNVPQSPLTLLDSQFWLTSGIHTPLLTLNSPFSAAFTQQEFDVDNKSWRIGVGGSATSSPFTDNFFIYDFTASKPVVIITSSDTVGIGPNGSAGCVPSAGLVLGVCGPIGTANYLTQTAVSSGTTNNYLETFQNSTTSTTNLMPGILVFGGQNATNVDGMDTGFNATSARFRSRVFGSNNGDISFAFHNAGTGPTSQSSFTDHMVIRGDTEHVAYPTGSAPAITACGSSPSIDAQANDISGTVTAGSGATGCVITFNAAYGSYNHCRVTFESSLTAASYSYTKTAITLAATALSGNIDYECDGQ